MTFENHFGEIWGLALNSIGSRILSVSSDMSVRVWRQTREQFFLEEEREKKLEKLMIKDIEAMVGD
jgi:U3 small nucleolar RNA-associated protein 12